MSGSEHLAEPILFEAAIVPHRSLSARGLLIVIGVVCCASALISAFFFWLGAWPVIGFSGAEVGLAVLLLRWNARAARAAEVVMLSESHVTILRTDISGRRSQRRLPTGWLGVMLQDRPGRAPGLWLVSRHVREEIGVALGEEEKRGLAAALRRAVHDLHHPVFDNPQLRDQAGDLPR